MKAQMLKLAGVKTEAAFYKKYPTQEAFAKVHGKELKKALNGFNPGNTSVPSSIGYTPMSKSLTSGASGIGSKVPGAGQILGAATGIIDAFGAFKGQKNELDKLKQQNQVVGKQREAQNSVDVDFNRMNKQLMWRPEDDIVAGGQVNAGQGTGTSILSKNGKKISKAKGGAEIQNTYAPNDIYQDLEEYRAGGIVKAAGGFSSFMGGGGMDFADKALGNVVDKNAGYQAGKAIGDLSSMIPVVGQIPGLSKGIGLVAGTLGSLADNAFGSAGKIKNEKKELTAQTDGMTAEAGVKSFQGQHGSSLKDGGYVSNDWTPQVITKFGDHSAKDFYDFSHEGMESLRAGGQIRGEYTPVSQRGLQTYALGGEVETTWGGEVKPIAYNPYLPKSGQIVEFKGNSHTESDGNGHTGIGVKYGDPDSYTDYAEFGSRTADANVEVQDGEPGYVDDKGNFNVGGALPLSLKMAKHIGSPELVKLAEKYNGMKVQNIIKDNASKTAKVGKQMIKVDDELNGITSITSTNDLLREKTLTLKKYGLDRQLKNLAGEVNVVTNFQTSINDTAKDISHELGYNISADHLAKYGTIKKDTDPVTKDSVAEKGKKVKKGSKPIKFARPEITDDGELPFIPKAAKTEAQIAEDEAKYSKIQSAIVGEDYDSITGTKAIDKDILAQDANSTNGGRSSWMDILNSVLPQLRPSNAEGMDQRQILGELNALSQNQLEAVQAQRYNPQLKSASTISLQDQMNEITAQTRAAQKMAQGNPAAQAAIAAQAYEAINKIKGEEFKVNQDRFDKIYASNIDTLNDSQLKNLAIGSKQAADQAAARSNTKAVTQAAHQSISDKYLQNDAANRKLQIAENTYNYRYDSKGRLINMNPLQQFSPSGAESRTGGKGLAPGYEFTYDSDQNIIGTRKAGKDDVAKNGTKVKSKNSSIVKAMRNL